MPLIKAVFAVKDPFEFEMPTDLDRDPFSREYWNDETGRQSDVSELYIPDSIEYINRFILRQFKNVQKIVAPGLKKVPGECCRGLTSLEIFEAPNVEAIEMKAFQYCSSLKKVSFPKLTQIGYAAFSGPEREKNGLEEIEAPNVIYIERAAFGVNKNLKRVSFPKLEKLGPAVFLGSGLEEIEAPNLEDCGPAVFLDCYSLKTVNFPKLKKISKNLFAQCYKLKQVKLNSAVTIEKSAFNICRNLKTVKLNSVVTIEKSAFRDCEKLEQAQFDSAVTIKPEAFLFCDKLITISLGSIKTISANAFRLCYSLKSLTNLPATFRPNKQTLIESFFLRRMGMEYIDDEFVPGSLVLIYKVPGSQVGKAYEILLKSSAVPKLSGKKWDQLAVSVPIRKAREIGKEMQAIEDLADDISHTPRDIRDPRSLSVFGPQRDRLQQQLLDSYGYRVPRFELMGDGADFIANVPKRPGDDAGGAAQRPRLE